MNLTIIGAGASGTSMLYQLSRVLTPEACTDPVDPASIFIRILERQEMAGPGFPHSRRNALPCHLINMCARDMGIVAGRPEDFQEWLDAHRDDLKDHFPDYRPYLESVWLREGPCTYVPRGVMGEYLKARFQEAVESLRRSGAGVEVLTRCEVEDIREESEGVRVVYRDAATGGTRRFLTDRVVLATGHWFDAGGDGHFFPSPWPPRALEQGIQPGERIAVIGSSLSAVDAALTLTVDGAFARRESGELLYKTPERPRRVALCSRSGLLPRVRGRTGSLRNAHFTRENLEKRRLSTGGRLTLRDLFELLDADLRMAYGRAISWPDVLKPKDAPLPRLEKDLRDARNGDGPRGELLWQTVLHQTFPMAREIYLNLRAEDRMVFDRDLSTAFFTFASPMPPANAEKLVALMRAGIVDVVSLGRDYATRREDGGAFVFEFTEASGRSRRERFDRVIDARGQARSFETNPSPLARNLLKSGTVEIEEMVLSGGTADSELGRKAYRTGGVWIDPETQRVMRKGETGRIRVSERIYAVGAPTRGQILDASMVYSAALAGDRIVRDLLRRIP